MSETSNCSGSRTTSAPLDTMVMRTFLPGDEVPFRELNECWITELFSMDEKDRMVLGDPATHVLAAGGQIYMAVIGDVPVGCCALIAMAGGISEVAKMAVAKTQRGRGIGRRLLAYIIEEARANGTKKLCLKTSSRLQPAIHLYASMGFRHTTAESTGLSPNQRADVFMELVLGGRYSAVTKVR